MQITQRELDRYRRQVAERQSDAKAYLIARMQSEVSGLSVAEAREATIEIMRDCMVVYSDQAQAVSADFFDELRDAGEIDAAPAEMFDDIIDDEMMQEKVHYFAGKLVDGDWDGYAGSNADLAAYYIHRSALQNMERNCYRNGVQYARVATGRETCGFCFMLSTRGFDYRSEDTASATSHVHCDCVIVPGKQGVTKIAGYEPEKMYERWKLCAGTLGGDAGLRAEFTALSKKELGKVKGRNAGEKWLKWRNAQISREVETRDNGWLYRGHVPEPTYVSESIEQSVTVTNPWEGRTGARLSALGFRRDFIRDYDYVDADGIKKRVGLPDLANGIEIKTPMTSKNPIGAIDNYFQSVQKKRGVKRLVIDNTESYFADNELISAVQMKLDEYQMPRVSVLTKAGKFVDVKMRA